MNLRSNEELLVQRAKKRPAIIISSGVDSYPEIQDLLRSKGKKHHQQDCCFLIPFYGILHEAYGTGFIPEMVARIQCLMYRQFFYIPRSSQFSEGIARFDRIQVIIDRNPAAIETSEVCLAEDVFNLFLAMFLYCVSGKSDEELETVRDILKEAYPEIKEKV